ncbi:hypothetical protein L7F22_053000 [Adiantum nelumboides]|nr:hypothetical protein [Adiantum nelumboides]
MKGAVTSSEVPDVDEVMGEDAGASGEVPLVDEGFVLFAFRRNLLNPVTRYPFHGNHKSCEQNATLNLTVPSFLVRAKDTDILAAFQITPQPGVPAEEAGAAVAATSSTVTRPDEPTKSNLQPATPQSESKPSMQQAGSKPDQSDEAGTERLHSTV